MVRDWVRLAAGSFRGTFSPLIGRAVPRFQGPGVVPVVRLVGVTIPPGSVFSYTALSSKPPVNPNLDMQNLTYQGGKIFSVALKVKNSDGSWTYFLPDSNAPKLPPGTTAWTLQKPQSDCVACHTDEGFGTMDTVFTQFYPALTQPSAFQPWAEGMVECD